MLDRRLRCEQKHDNAVPEAELFLQLRWAQLVELRRRVDAGRALSRSSATPASSSRRPFRRWTSVIAHASTDALSRSTAGWSAVTVAWQTRRRSAGPAHSANRRANAARTARAAGARASAPRERPHTAPGARSYSPEPPPSPASPSLLWPKQRGGSVTGRRRPWPGGQAAASPMASIMDLRPYFKLGDEGSQSFCSAERREASAAYVLKRDSF